MLTDGDIQIIIRVTLCITVYFLVIRDVHSCKFASSCYGSEYPKTPAKIKQTQNINLTI